MTWETPIYEWNDDNTEITAVRQCGRDKCDGLESETVSSKGEIIQQPTCTEKGKTRYTSSLFTNEAFEVQTKMFSDVPAIGNDWSAWTKLNDEEHQRGCANDPEHKETEAHAWNEGEVTTAATCTEPGVKTYTCIVCGATRTETIAKLPKPSNSLDPSNPSNFGGSSTGVPANSVAEGASAAAVTKYLTTRQDDSDPPGSTFGKLAARVTNVGKTSQKVVWNSVPGAVKYNIYANKCGKTNKLLFLGSFTGTSFTHKGLKKGTYYKYMVVAVDKNERVAASSKVVHSATAGGKVGNFKKVKTAAKKNKVNLKTGKKFKLKAKGVKGKGKVRKHRAICYESSNPAVATVSKKGIIKGVAPGKCIVYAYAQNGVFTKVIVTIK